MSGKGSVRVLVEWNGKRESLSPEGLEKLTGAAFRPRLEPESEKVASTIARQYEKLKKKEKISSLQLWQGAYFRKEIDSGYMPPLSLRWLGHPLGWGVFAERDFKVKEYIAEYAGVLRKWKRSDRMNGYCFQYVHLSGEETPYLIDARDQGGISRYINHSSNGNVTQTLATVDPFTYVIFLTNRPVKKGEQISYDYGPAYWEKRESPMPLFEPSQPLRSALFEHPVE